MLRVKSSRKRLSFFLISVTLLVLLLLWATIQSAAASSRPGYLSAFGTAYSSSTSNNAGCQLCHQGAGGGDGWNAYGWSLRQQIIDNGVAAEDAITAVEGDDADGNGISNIDEINANAQPGWAEGSGNTIFFSDGSTSADQAPPDGITPLDGQPTHVSFSGQQIVTTAILPLIMLFTLFGMVTVGIRRQW